MTTRNHQSVRLGLGCALTVACMVSVVGAAEPSAAHPDSPEFPMRTWHDDTGKHEVEATFVELMGDKAFLQKADGKTIGVPVLRLRIDDRRVVAKSVVERATAGLRSRQLDGPLAELNDLLQLNPSCTPAWLVRAKVWILRKDLGRAVADLDRAIEISSDDIPLVALHFFRGSVHWIQGNRESAIADYDQAMTLTASFRGVERRPEWLFHGDHADDSKDDAQADQRDPFFGSPSSPPRKPPFTVTISRQTTRALGPLRERGGIDYVAAVNDRCRQGVTPENNAVIPLLQAVGPKEFDGDEYDRFCKSIGMPAPPEQGPYFASLEDYVADLASEEPITGEGNTRRDPWDEYKGELRRPWTRKQYPVLSDWIQTNDEPMQRIVEASRRPRYYAPLIENREDAGMVGLWLPLAPDVREASRLLAARAMLRLGEGKVPEARQDLLACHRLARLVGQGPTLVSALVRISIGSFACDSEVALARYGNLTARQAQQYGADLDKLKPRPNVSDKFDVVERYLSLDVAVRVATGGPGAYLDMWNRLLLDSGQKGLTIGDQNPMIDNTWLYNETLDWDELLRITNAVYDQMVTACRHSSRADRVRALAEFHKQTISMSGRLKGNLTGPRIMSLVFGVVPPEVKVEHMAEVFLSLSLPSAQLVVDAEDRQTVRWQLCRLAYALAGYRADDGGYPERLSQLSPKYIGNIPTDLFTGKQLRYTRVAHDEYRLYSLGPNGKDDGGKEDDVAVWDSE